MSTIQDRAEAQVKDVEYDTNPAWAIVEGYKRGFRDGLAESPSKGIKDENEKLKSLLRELVMRSQLTFPECMKDQELWEAGIKDQPELFLEIGKALSLGNVEEEFDPYYNYKTAKEYEKT